MKNPELTNRPSCAITGNVHTECHNGDSICGVAAAAVGDRWVSIQIMAPTCRMLTGFYLCGSTAAKIKKRMDM